MNGTAIVIAVCAGVTALGVAWYVGQVSFQITYITLADGRRRERRLPMALRLLLPFAPNAKWIFSRPSLEPARARLRRSLVAAGYQDLIQPHEMLALRLLMPLILGGGGILLGYAVLHRLPGRMSVLGLEYQVLLYVAIMGIMAGYPVIWLKRMVRKRHEEIERALPFVLDLMTLSVEAGIDFMTAVRRIVERREPDALSEELMRLFRQIQIGKTRRAALRDMAARVDHPDIHSVANALIQADELGASIGTALRIQADQMRTRRYQRAEKMANEAPVKLLFPLIAFIFPAVFIVLLAPILAEILQQGF